MAEDRPVESFAKVGAAFLGRVAQRLQTLKVEELSAADTARWADVALKLQQAGSHTRYNREARLGNTIQPRVPIDDDTPPETQDQTP